jgi:hypothetical protein
VYHKGERQNGPSKSSISEGEYHFIKIRKQILQTVARRQFQSNGSYVHKKGFVTKELFTGLRKN